MFVNVLKEFKDIGIQKKTLISYFGVSEYKIAILSNYNENKILLKDMLILLNDKKKIGFLLKEQNKKSKEITKNKKKRGPDKGKRVRTCWKKNNEIKL